MNFIFWYNGGKAHRTTQEPHGMPKHPYSLRTTNCQPPWELPQTKENIDCIELSCSFSYLK